MDIVEKSILKKALAVLAALVIVLALAVSLCGCDDGSDAGSSSGAVVADSADFSDAGSSGAGSSDMGSSSGTAGKTGLKKTKAGLSIKVDESSGKMSIKRPAIKEPSPMGKADTWTVFVYMCGSDLESKKFMGGMGPKDIKEMCKATASKKVRFVIETGGSGYWHNKKIESEVIGRYVIEKGKLKNVGEKERASMGKASTLSDFLLWGIKKYPAEKMGIVFWDHGGGSITGVCFDELAKNDSLSLREIDAALLGVLKSGKLTDKFEFIGFDACLMGTVEAANISASYADYMIGSEESEPGSGWDYTAIGSYLAKHPEADGAAAGKVVCDSFKKQCEKSGDGQIATMSVIDLAEVDPLMKKFNSFAQDVYAKSEKKKNLTKMVRKIRAVENFGGNNKAEGYTNMVDMGGLIASCKKWTDNSKAAGKALKKAVVYKIAGSDHKKASGLSVYYPLAIQGSGEMKVFESVCVSPYYLSFVGRQGYGSVNSGDTEEYAEDEELFAGGFWNWLDNYLVDEESGDYYYDDEESECDWGYFDDHDDGAQSELITFAEKPGMDADGRFSFVLDDAGYENTADILGLVYQEQKDGTFVELGETYDVNIDWDSGYVSDNFDGNWLSLPDGQNLATYIVEATDDFVVYTSPILLNGEETYLRMRQYFDNGKVRVDGTWDGIDESGAASKNIVKLKKGDEITPTYYSIDEKVNDQDEYEGEPYKIKSKKGKLGIAYDAMCPGDYGYAFCIVDVYGDDYITDLAEFHINKKSEISFYE